MPLANRPDVTAVFERVCREGMARSVDVAAGCAGGRAPDPGFPEAVGEEVDDTLVSLEDPSHLEERGRLGEE